MEGMGDIPVVVAVAETQGFAAAARRLGVSKSAVSKRITQIEKRLGAQLFHRSTRNVSLTEAGEHFYAHAVRAQEAAQEAEDSVLALQEAPKGRLSVNVPMAFGRLHVAPLISGFLECYPGVSVDMVMDDRVADLFADGFDLALRGGTLADSALVARKIAPLHNVLVAAPAYLERHGAPETVSGLSRHNCLQYSYSRDFQEWVFDCGGEVETFRPGGSYSVNNGEALREAVLGGTGIGRLPTFTTGPDLAAGRLVRVLPHCHLPSQTLYAIYPERRYLPAKVRVFIDFILEHLGGDVPPWDRATGV
ncbi:LysR family transcriptional regulator [Leisingera aquaemixtae]|uniref:LysR family transcriptional regulator n=1 Tax=Leisingera aquaemixtae TaxID=1396826 RepID=UPI001C9738CE|nr:LysR family transcriptional regulator [Leisingera aquaemixtae]MBY6066638.1 LysR family transcriptional regulator [Leisingera aquaemixtae]